MPLLGQAAVAMWWNVRAEQRAEWGDWHSHEHFPERLSIPGFQRGSRWTSTSDAEGFFVLYELATYETLSSKGYLDRLNSPTPWSTKMMPHHLGMVRSQCRVVASFGGGVATSLATIRLSPQSGAEQGLKTALSRDVRRAGGAARPHRRASPRHRHAADRRANARAADPRARTRPPTGSCCCRAMIPTRCRKQFRRRCRRNPCNASAQAGPYSRASIASASP